MAFDAMMTHRHPPPPLCLWSPQDCYWYMRAAGDGGTGSESGKRGKAKLPAGRRTSLERANSTSPCLLFSAFVLAMEIAKVLGNRKKCFMIFGNWFILTWSIKAGKRRLVVVAAPKPELSWQKGINESPWRGPTRCVTSLAFIASWVWFLLLVVFFALQALQKM